MSTQVRIEPLTEADVEALAALAREIWLAHYPGIISIEQIEYMLAQRYTPAHVRAELGRNDLWWDKLVIDGEIAGFASYFFTDNPGEMKLDKLYVRQDRQRMGCGGLMIAHVCAFARRMSCTRLTLAVNRMNAGAIAAYRRHGFAVKGAVVKDIGGGFVMDDYIMEKALHD
jgi:diamine N-acetyltransferase